MECGYDSMLHADAQVFCNAYERMYAGKMCKHELCMEPALTKRVRSITAYFVVRQRPQLTGSVLDARDLTFYWMAHVSK